jgi:hypothetical protein
MITGFAYITKLEKKNFKKKKPQSSSKHPQEEFHLPTYLPTYLPTGVKIAGGWVGR